MMKYKRKKLVKRRGHKTHGWGSKKKRRGAGNRGGRGMAGTGKRADQKKPSIINKYGNSYFGKRGFKRPQSTIKKIKTINVCELGSFKERVDLTSLGYDKLLGSGRIEHPIEVKVVFASKKAIEKIEKAGGKVLQE